MAPPGALPRRALILSAALAAPAVRAAAQAIVPGALPQPPWLARLAAIPRTAGPSGLRPPVPPDAVPVPAGANLQAAVAAHPPGTAFALGPGTFHGPVVQPQPGQRFFGAPASRGGTVLEGGGRPRAFQGQGVPGVVVSGLGFTGWAPPKDGVGILGTDASATGWRVEACTFEGNARGPALMLGEAMHVVDCVFRDNAQCGIAAWRIRDAVVDHCEIAGNNRGREWPFTPTGSAAGAKLAWVTGLRFTNNRVHGQHASFGLWLDVNGSGSLIARNLIEGNEVGGILLELDYGATIRENILRDNNPGLADGFRGGGLYVQNSAGAEVAHNLLLGNGGGVWLFENERGAGARGPWRTRENRITANLIAMDRGHNGLGGTAQDETSNRFDGNAYYMAGTAAFVLGREVSAQRWRAAGQDAADTGATMVSGPWPPRGR